MSGTKLDIVEIFESIQGEGYWTGTPASFIRLAGCNRECSFCDTDRTAYHCFDTDQIMNRIRKQKHRHVVITGGEPALQNINPIVMQLQLEHYRVQVETNGDQKIEAVPNWTTVSPKELLPTEIGIRTADELKIVIVDEAHAKKFRKIASLWTNQEICRFKHFFLQPNHYNPREFHAVHGMNIELTLKLVKKLGSPWRLSIQTHKLLCEAVKMK